MGAVAGIGWWFGVVGLGVGAAAAWWVINRAPARVVAGVAAVELNDAPRLENLVEGLCLSNGLAPPRLMVVESSARNSLTVGLSVDATTLVVTRGLLTDLSRMELEGVVARQLALIKGGHTAYGTVVAALASFWSGAVDRLIEARSAVVADMEAVELTRYPPGLLGALECIQADPVVASAPSWTRHLWIDDPIAPAGGRPSTSHSPIDERLATLREL